MGSGRGGEIGSQPCGLIKFNPEKNNYVNDSRKRHNDKMPLELFFSPSVRSTRSGGRFYYSTWEIYLFDLSLAKFTKY